MFARVLVVKLCAFVLSSKANGLARVLVEEASVMLFVVGR